MRIITGKLGGRQFTAPTGHHTHPMSEKARGALFNMLGDISGLTVLDCFAGTGALCYEAISRGAMQAVAIELDKGAQKMIKRNVDELGLQDQISLFPGSCQRWSARNKEQLFDLVLCDPPYDRLLFGVIEKLSRHVKPGGLLALSWPGHLKAEVMPSLQIVKASNYGDAQLIFYRLDKP